MKTQEEILICAVRYALGRQSYMVGVVAGYVTTSIKELSKECLKVIAKDIEEAIEECHAQGRTCGMKCDERTWQNLLELLNHTIYKGCNADKKNVKRANTGAILEKTNFRIEKNLN